MRGSFLLLACIALHLACEAAAQPKFEIFEPLAGAEYTKDQEIVLSFQGTDFPKNNRRAELHLNKKKLRDLPLPQNEGDVFNVTLTGVKKGRHEFDVILFYGLDPLKEEVLDVWGSFFFVGSETARLSTKLKEGKKKAGSREWAADTMLTWLTSKGADVEKITVKETAGEGSPLGLFTVPELVRAGETVAELPFSATLGPESAARNMYKEFLLTLYSDKDFPAQFANAVHLILELQQEGSHMLPWIHTLPPYHDESLNVALSWDRHDQMRAVRLLPMLTKTAHDQQTFFDRGYERLWAVMDMYEKDFKKLKKSKKMPKLSLFTRGNMVWAMSVVLTRAWRCPNTPDVVFEGYSHRPGLYRIAPPTDAINFLPNGHLPYPSVPRDSHGHIVITVNNTDAMVRMIALEDMKKGTQAFLHVGDLTNRELMVQYGFIRRPNLFDPGD
uniref:SET domain-containing protein n=1 Tax=Hemiselmis tepida TaxID=464990 RepID=A0A7S0YIB4_9CRYP|mmetsp:Transcript_11208/g.29124  ORF Transcript_11208/g.29124 Transcript_11208/m.29124 type:complete len:443 (+) Transcript_11208:25-1353(+)